MKLANYRRVELYLPSRTAIGTILDGVTVTKILQHVRHYFSEWFGGCTDVKGHGNWLSDDTGKLHSESVRIVYAYASEAVIASLHSRLLSLANYVRVTADQESVLLTIPNPSGVDLYFVDKTYTCEGCCRNPCECLDDDCDCDPH